MKSEILPTPEFGEEAKKNITELNMLLRIMRGQKLIGHAFDADFKELFLFFERSVISINLKNAKWDVVGELIVFPSPILEEIPWET